MNPYFTLPMIIVITMIGLTGCHNNKSLAQTIQSQHKVMKPQHSISAKALPTKEQKRTITKKKTMVTKHTAAKHTAAKHLKASQVKKALLSQYKNWKHVRYQLGGNNKRGIDCSGFTQVTFQSKFNISLPHNTIKQTQNGKRIDKKQLRAGDLVFFKTGRNIRHVGIYLDQQRFLHASTSKGVIISKLGNSYWMRHYWKAVRVSGI